MNIDNNNYGLETNTNSMPIDKPLLHKDLSRNPRKDYWNYQTEVGMLTYVQRNSRPKITTAVHQTAYFCNNPMISYEKAIKNFG